MDQAKKRGIAKPKILTGNPHLAVERAERRFGFEVVRIVEDGAICLEKLRRAIEDPDVLAVYSQTLSYTDGISDPLGGIVDIVEKENQTANQTDKRLVTIINDSCLAFSVLVHNDGCEGRANMRVLDLTKNCITPVMVTLDAHKHLGTDKGVSTILGTQGTLDPMRYAVKVGSQPSKEELVRAIADMWLVGIDGYQELYRKLVSKIDSSVEKIEAEGMTLIHAKNRINGSTVIAVEDPSSVMQRKLKKMGHSTAALYNMCPAHPSRCQLGFGLSLTLHVLREVNDKGECALDVFVNDLIQVYRRHFPKKPLVYYLCRESHPLAVVTLGGNTDNLLFNFLTKPGAGREFVTTVVRRFMTALLDSGVACKENRTHPLRRVGNIVMRVLAIFACLLVACRKGMPRRALL